jgi:esterase
MRVYFECYGAGRPLLVLHGLFGSLENWRTLSKTFSRSFAVFAIDQRNHGRSPHSDIFTYPAMAEDLKEFMQQRGLSSAHLLGHSLGGKTAMQLAVAYPEMVNKLVVVDIAPKAYPPGHDDIFHALYTLDIKAFRSRQEADTQLSATIPDAALRQFLLKNLEREASGTLRWRINLDSIHSNYAEILKEIRTDHPFDKPTLFIKGGQSDYIRQGDEPLIRQAFPQAQLVTIPAAGHWVHAEAPQEFARLVLEFLLED